MACISVLNQIVKYAKPSIISNTETGKRLVFLFIYFYFFIAKSSCHGSIKSCLTSAIVKNNKETLNANFFCTHSMVGKGNRAQLKTDQPPLATSY